MQVWINGEQRELAGRRQRRRCARRDRGAGAGDRGRRRRRCRAPRVWPEAVPRRGPGRGADRGAGRVNVDDDPLVIGGRKIGSRLIMGTGGAANLEVLERALVASGTELTTVAMRRVDAASGTGVLDLLAQARHRGPAQHGRLPHGRGGRADRAAGPRGAGDRPGQARGGRRRPHAAARPVELLDAAEQLVDDGFTVLPYTNDDPVLALRLEQVGCAAVMPLGSPIGTGLGIRNPHNIELIVVARPACRSSSTPASAPRRTPRRRWSWVAPRCCWRPPSPGRRIRSGWPPPCARRRGRARGQGAGRIPQRFWAQASSPPR